ncbi:MAG: hypothetical protein GEU73_00060 [Chloroflexi bacterium]|nr:hypothetical protein [Chloroflexota bacterium]
MSFSDVQFRDVPNWQPALTDLRTRQGLIYAIDRVGMGDAITLGLAPAADTFVAPPDPLFPEIDRVITKYPYDPDRAQARFAEDGWHLQPSGRLTDANGQTLNMDIMGSSGDAQAASIVGDSWKAVGINASQTIISAQRERDREYRASCPGIQFNGRSISVENFHFVAAEMPRPEIGYVELNRGSFQDDEVDRLYQLALTSLDTGERDRAWIAVQQRMAALAPYIPLHYSVEVILARNGLRGLVGNYGPQIGATWNVFERELVQ